MIFSLAVSKSDISIFPALVNSMVKFGGFESNRIIVLPAPSVASDAIQIAKPLEPMCRQYDMAPLNIEPEGGWPQACNQHFAAALEKMHELKIDEPFMWVEPDCCFSQYNAPNTLLTEYHMAKKPYMGHKRATKEVMEGADGEHMVACGIYPADFYTRTRLWQFIRQDQPFDVWLRWEIAPHCHDTNLIQHAPRTWDWHTPPAGPVLGTNKDSGQDWKTFDLSKGAVMVHGCKDGSLSQLVCGDSPPKTGPIMELPGEAVFVEPVNIFNFTPTTTLPSTTEEDEGDEHFKAVLGAIQDWRIQVPGVSRNPTEARLGHAKLILDAYRSVVLPPSKKYNDTHDALLELLGSYDDKEATVNTAADELKVSPDLIRELAKEYKGWFKLTGLGDFMVKLTPKGVKMAAKT